MITFSNPGTINPLSIVTFGVSVKDSSNPIGFFGTGLKYAIAVLLRNGQSITIKTGGDTLRFATQAEAIRGKSFQLVTMQTNEAPPQPLGFTTELGKNWELWMAYRELACNCMDEDGTIKRDFTLHKHMLNADSTVITVKGDAFDAIYEKRKSYILETNPLITSSSASLSQEPSNHLFYRSVNVGAIRTPAIFTYNLLDHQDLTEDRTLKSMWYVPHALGTLIQQCTDRNILQTVLTAPESTFESSFVYCSSGETSKEFLAVVEELSKTNIHKLNTSAVQTWKKITKKAFAPTQIHLTPVEQQMAVKALQFISTLGYDIIGSGYEIQYVDNLGQGVLGMADVHGTLGSSGIIYIAHASFTTGGTKSVALTLLEEFIHIKTGHADESLGLQQFLFDKIISMGEDKQGSPL